MAGRAERQIQGVDLPSSNPTNWNAAPGGAKIRARQGGRSKVESYDVLLQEYADLRIQDMEGGLTKTPKARLDRLEAELSAGLGISPDELTQAVIQLQNDSRPAIIRGGKFSDGSDGYSGQNTTGRAQEIFKDTLAEAAARNEDPMAYYASDQMQGAQSRVSAKVEGFENVVNQLDTARGDEWRGRQLSLADKLTAQAEGKGPSLAMEQLKSATDRNLAQTAAMAQTTAGAAGPALAARNAMRLGAETSQQAARDSGALRIQEQRSAQDALSQVLQGGRMIDAGEAAANLMAKEQATGRDLSVSLANLQSELQQRGMNDNYELGMYDRATGRQDTDFQRDMAVAGLDLAKQTGAGAALAAKQQYELGVARTAKGK